MDPELMAVALSARDAAEEGIKAGVLTLSEFHGMSGVWANGPTGRFFVNLAAPADRVVQERSENPEDHYFVWAHGKKGKRVQVHVDRNSDEIINVDDVLNDLMDDDEIDGTDDTGEPSVTEFAEVVDLSEVVPLDALAEGGGVVSLSVCPWTGVIVNWYDKEPFVSQNVAVDLAAVGAQSVNVRSYLRGGKMVRQYQQGRAKAQPKGAPAGARFVGYAPHVGYERPKDRGVNFKDAQGARVSYEAVPSDQSPLHAQYAKATYEQKLAATQAVVKALQVDGKDSLADALGLPAPRLSITPGYWKGVSNPSVQADFPITQYGEREKLAVKAYAAVLGSALEQDAVGYHYATPVKDNSQANAVEVRTSIPVTKEHMLAVNSKLNEDDGIVSIASTKGVRFLSLGSLDNDEFHQKVTDVMHEVLGDQAKNAWTFAVQSDLLGGDDVHESQSAYQSAIRELNASSSFGRDVQGAIVGIHDRVHGAFRDVKLRGATPDDTGTSDPRVIAPDSIDAPGQWAVYKHPGGEHGDYGLYHPETGERAPEGVISGNVEGRDQKGRGIDGLKQGKAGIAAIHKNANEEYRQKLHECVNLADSLPKLRRKVDKALSGDGLSRSKLAATVVLLMQRQQFRVGSKVGDSSLKSKGAVDETFGACVLRPEHVKIAGNKVVFEFPGKSGKAWKKIDSDPRTLEIIQALLATAEPGKPLFQYEEGGRKRSLSATDVREFLREFEVIPHNFRHYAASLTYYQQVRKGKTHSEALREAAAKINDEESTTAKNYILAGLQDAARSGKLDDFEWLKPLKLAESEDQSWFEIQFEEEFHNLLNHLDSDGPEDDGVMLADGEYGSAPPKSADLRQGDRWITIKPHGPDHPDYRHVLIRDIGGGRAKIVWAGNKGLNHLVLNKVGDKSDIERAQQRKPKQLTPEQAKAEQENRQVRMEALQKNREDFGNSVLKELGLHGTVDVNDFLDAYDTVFKPPPKEKREVSDEEKRANAERLEKKLQDIANGEDPGGKGLQDTEALENATAEKLMSDITGEVPKELGKDVSPELREAWDKIRDRVDPDLTNKILALANRRRLQENKIKRDTAVAQSVRVMGTMGFYDNPDEATKDLLKSQLEKFEYQRRSQFAERTASMDNAEKYHTEGMKDGLTFALANHGADEGENLNTNTVHLFGPEVVAEVIAHHIRSKGEGARKTALENLERDFVQQEFQTVQDAMERSDAIRAERQMVATEAMAGTLLQTAAARALAELTIAEKKHLCRAAGSLESVALVMDSLRQQTPRAINIDASAAKRDDLMKAMTKAGMVEGEDFYHVQESGKVMLHVPVESAGKMLRTVKLNAKLDDQRAMIKSHEANTSDFHIPGMATQLVRGAKTIPLKLTDEQQAAIRYFEAEGQVLGNLGVGLGKTITFGAAHSRLMEKRKAEGKAHHGWYIVPANLVQEMHKGLTEAFPGMKIAKVTKVAPEKRKGVYAEKHDLTIISSDMVRQDASFLADMCNGEHKPAAIYGDEVHTLFTPNEKEDSGSQSQRSQALTQLRAEHMLVMTGTPFRQSVAEVYKVADWIKPGSLGSFTAFMTRYGKLGQGTTAWQDAQFSSLQQALDPVTITEKDPPPVKHHQHKVPVNPSTHQIGALKKAYGDHYARLKKGEKPSKSAGALNSKVHDILGGGDHHTNPVLKHISTVLEKHDGDRAIIHCESTAMMHASCGLRPSGTILPMWSGTSTKDRERIKNALNYGTMCEGARGKAGGFEGVATAIHWDFGGKPESDENCGVPAKVKLKSDDGREQWFDAKDVSSLVQAMAGTSVTSTGLNLQGCNVNIHAEAANSAAVREQRDARALRRGQRKDVHSYYMIPNMPFGRRKDRKLGDQEKAMKGVDDPMQYGSTSYMDAVMQRHQAVRDLSEHEDGTEPAEPAAAAR